MRRDLHKNDLKTLLWKDVVFIYKIICVSVDVTWKMQPCGPLTFHLNQVEKTNVNLI